MGSIQKVWLEAFLDRFPISYLSVAIIFGCIIYVAGMLISFFTDNLIRFIFDFPWLVYTVYIIIGMWATPHFLKMHRRAFLSVRQILMITDEEFSDNVKKFNKRLASLLSIPSSLFFFPILLWVSMNRLWWNEYNSVILYDVYIWIIFSIVLVANGIGIWTGCVAFNLNYRDISEIPLNGKSLISQSFKPLKSQFGGLSLKITLLFLVFSTLSNLPIIMLTKTQGTVLNFIIALSMTLIVFVTPQIIFHRLMIRIKNEEIIKIKELYDEHYTKSYEYKEDEKITYENLHRILTMIHLRIHRQDISRMSEWLIDLRSLSIVIITLFLSTTIKIILGDILKPFLSLS